MTTSGDSSNQPGAQGDQPQSMGGPAPQQPVAPSDPTILRQPNQPDPQQDPTLLRPFDQPQGGFAPGFAQPDYPSSPQQPGPGYAQPAPGQAGGAQGQGFAPGPGFAPPNQGAVPGQGFAQQGQGFPPQGQAFAAPGQGFPPAGQGPSAQGQVAQGQGYPSGGFGQGTPASGFAQPAPGYGPAGPASSGPAAKGWLWGLGGVVVASAVWGGAVLAFGGVDGGGSSGVAPGEPDLRGYTYSADFCQDSDTSPFTDAGYTVSKKSSTGKDDYPNFEGSEHAAVDSMFCAQRFLPQGVDDDDYEDAYMYSGVTIHKKSDPGPEFTAGYDTWENSRSETSGDGRKEKISGLGDEAWVAIEPSKPGDPSPTVTIRVRDGWVVGHFTWSQYVSTSSSSKPKAEVLPESEVIDKLTASAESTLAALRD